MSDLCKHDLSEQDTYIADGYCPLCLLDLVQAKDQRIERLEAALRQMKIDHCKWNHSIADRCECGYSRAALEESK